MLKKKISLVIVVIAILSAIFYLESQKPKYRKYVPKNHKLHQQPLKIRKI